MSEARAIVVGAGPAGLAVAACLRRAGVEPVVVERADRVGNSWENHYHRLHLHTPGATSGLPGLAFPREAGRYPSRQAVVDHLREYARVQGIAPRFGVEVRGARWDGGWRVSTSEGELRAPSLVMATGANGRPNLPSMPGLDTFPGTVVHSSGYRTGADFAGRRVLVVGCGNSGAEIAVDLHEQGAVASIVVRGPVHVVPRDLMGMPSARTSIALRHLPAPVADALTVPIIRLAVGDLSRFGIVRPSLGPRTLLERTGRVPILDIGLVALIRSGAVRVVPGVASVEGEEVTFADGGKRPFDAIVLATGFVPDVARLIDGEVFDAAGAPVAHGAETLPGLYFVGYHNVVTGLLREIGLEARRVAQAIAGSP